MDSNTRYVLSLALSVSAGLVYGTYIPGTRFSSSCESVRLLLFQHQQQTGVHSGIIGPSLGTNNCGDKSMFPLRELLSCHDSDSCPASKVSFVSGAFILGAMLANLSGSAVSRRIGLKGIIALSAVLLQIGTYGTVIFSSDEITFAVWRFVVGLAVGQLSFCVPFWLSQNSPPDSRG